MVLQALLADPTRQADTETLKYSASTRVYRTHIELSGHRRGVIAKQWIARGLRGRIAGAVGQSRAKKSLHRAQWLHEAGVGTARPLAIIERKRERDSWLLTESIDDAHDLDRVVLTHLPTLDRHAASRCKRAIIQRVVEVFVHLRRAGLHHRDLKASNLLLTNLNDSIGPRIWIVDLDGLSRARMVGGNRAHQPLIRLAASLLSYPAVTRGDYARFLHAYRNAFPQPLEFQEAYRELSRAAGQYLTDSRKRKAGKLDGYDG